jgi:hypothetical protein
MYDPGINGYGIPTTIPGRIQLPFPVWLEDLARTNTSLKHRYVIREPSSLRGKRSGALSDRPKYEKSQKYDF